MTVRLPSYHLLNWIQAKLHEGGGGEKEVFNSLINNYSRECTSLRILQVHLAKGKVITNFNF